LVTVLIIPYMSPLYTGFISMLVNYLGLFLKSIQENHKIDE